MISMTFSQQTRITKKKKEKGHMFKTLLLVSALFDIECNLFVSFLHFPLEMATSFLRSQFLCSLRFSLSE